MRRPTHLYHTKLRPLELDSRRSMPEVTKPICFTQRLPHQPNHTHVRTACMLNMLSSFSKLPCGPHHVPPCCHKPQLRCVPNTPGATTSCFVCCSQKHPLTANLLLLLLPGLAVLLPLLSQRLLCCYGAVAMTNGLPAMRARPAQASAGLHPWSPCACFPVP